MTSLSRAYRKQAAALATCSVLVQCGLDGDLYQGPANTPEEEALFFRVRDAHDACHVFTYAGVPGWKQRERLAGSIINILIGECGEAVNVAEFANLALAVVSDVLASMPPKPESRYAAWDELLLAVQAVYEAVDPGLDKTEMMAAGARVAEILMEAVAA